MTQPNIILILTDHFRRDALRPNVTPNLVRLAGQGTQFTNAYSASPLCQPARNCIITGRHASDNGICGNQQPPLTEALRHDTFMHHLRSAGYSTAMIGKHHYIDRYGIGMDVTDDDETLHDYGFDHVFQVVDYGESRHNSDEYTRWLDGKGKLEEFRSLDCSSGKPFPWPVEECIDGFIGTYGVGFVEKYAGKEPFYLNLSFVGPHPPFWHPGETREGLADGMPLKEAESSDQLKRQRCRYLEKCAIIDKYVGELVDALEARGLLDNTVILFTSDHGEMLGDRGIWDKRHFYEESVGVPLFIAGASVAGEERMCGARVSKSLVSHLDLYPTVLDLAGVKVPRDVGRPGKSLLQILDESTDGHDCVIAELATAMMIRTANWKMVFDPQAGGVQQLYNLAADPEELANLAGTSGYEHVVLELTQRLLSDKIRRTQSTQVKEEQRLQRVHIG